MSGLADLALAAPDAVAASWAAFGLAVVAGAIGSGHCVGMCGPFASFAGALRRGAWDSTLSYQVGRLTAYIGVGVVAGLASELLGRAAQLFALQRALAVVTGVALVVVGASAAFGGVTMPGRMGAVGRRWASAVGRLSAMARGAGPRAGPYLLGMSASLLPCGLLWSFALAAAATGTMVGAVATMLGFWLGTAPGLVAAAWLAGRVGRGPLRHARRVVGVGLIALGVLGVSGRWGVAPQPGAAAVCHGAAAPRG